MVNQIVFQIVGFQNSGKTTFIHSLIERLNDENIKVATIKHHGHGGKPDINERKDSSLHIQAGALVSIVEGEGRLILQAEKNIWNLSEQLKLLSHFQMDCILVEGHKFENYPKAVIISCESDMRLIKDLANIKILLFRHLNLEQHKKDILTIPAFQIQDPESLNWIVSYLKSQLK